MNELIPVHDRDRPLVAELDTEMVDWYVSNMPPNTIRAYKKAVDKIDAWLARLPSTMPRSLGLSNSRKLSEIIPLNRTRMDYQERFEQIIAEYNAAAIDVDVWFEQLIALAEELNASDVAGAARQLGAPASERALSGGTPPHASLVAKLQKMGI